MNSEAILKSPSPTSGEGRGEGSRREVSKSSARKLRISQTDAERKLWRYLRGRGLESYKFRRQFPVGPFIADFCCLRRKLIIELDGGHHGEREGYDASRTDYLEKQGFAVRRFWNNDVMNNVEGVLERILEQLKAPSPRPLPRRERGNA